MAPDNWHVQLEAYLDGELDAAAAAAFEAETAASPALQAELSARRDFRAVARDVLLREAPPYPHHARPAARRPRFRTWTAAAAALALLLLAPWLLRLSGVSSPSRADELRAGQVVAIRFGELPGVTAVLEVGCYDQATDTVH